MTPPALEHVVNTCLAKDPDDRFQTARDVTLELQWIAEGGSQGGISAPAVAHRKNRGRLGWGFVLFLIAVVAAIAGWNLKPLPSGAQRPVTRFAITPPETAPLAIDVMYPEISISSDGKHNVYVARNTDGKMQLYLRVTDQLEVAPIIGTESEYIANPFFSPDGSEVGFFDERGLKRVSTHGGLPVTVYATRDFTE